MDKDTVELDLPGLVEQEPYDLHPALIQERKRFDEERQKLRKEITALRQQTQELEQQYAVKRERESDRLYQQNVQLTNELFALRHQLQEQANLPSPELERLQGLLAESQRCADTLRLELTEVQRDRDACQARLQELEQEQEMAVPRQPGEKPIPVAPVAVKPPEPVAPVAVKPPKPPEPVVAVKPPEPVAAVRPAAASKPSKPPVASKPRILPAADLEEPIQDLKNSFHRSGNPIPVLIAQSDDDDEASSGWVVERSMGGLTLLLDQELATGKRLRVRNARPTCTTAAWCVVTIKHCQPEGNSFRLVCRFVEQPSWESIQQFW